ncbi:unnamed protein product, partial [Rotaria socialis]
GASTATATTITTRSATTMQMSSESIFTKKEFSSTHEGICSVLYVIK